MPNAASPQTMEMAPMPVTVAATAEKAVTSPNVGQEKRTPLSLKEIPGLSPKDQDIAAAARSRFLVRGIEARRMKPDELRKNPAQAELATYADFVSAADTFPEKPIELNGGSQIALENGAHLTAITGVSGENFVCQTSDGQSVQIPAEIVMNEQLMSAWRTNPEVQKLFTEKEIKVIEAHIDSASGGQEGKSAAVTEEEINEVAASAGLISADAVKSFVGNYRRETDITKIDGADDAAKQKTLEENQKYNAQLDALLEPLKDRQVAPPEAVSDAIKYVGSEELDGQMMRLQLEIFQVTSTLSASENPEQQAQLTKYLAELRADQGRLKKMADSMHNSEPVIDLYRDVQLGNRDVADAQTVEQALRTNNGEELMRQLTGVDMDDEIKAAGFLDKAKKIAKKYGSTIGIASALMAWLLYKKTEEDAAAARQAPQG